MGALDAMSISASGLTADQMWTNVIAENLANMNSVETPGGIPYREEAVVMAPREGSFGQALSEAGVEVSALVQSNAPFRMVYEPSSPLADAQGYVRYPNVNEVSQMTDLTAASASYQANASAMAVEEADAQAAIRMAQGA